MNRLFLLLILLLPALVHGQEIYVGVPPLKYAAEKLLDSEVGVVLQPGDNPHSFQPTARQIARISQAKVLFTTGLPFENQLADRLSGAAPNLAIVATDAGLPKRKFNTTEGSHDHSDHDHKNDYGSSCGADAAKDPHVWLSPRHYASQCKVMAEVLMEAFPEKREMIHERLVKLEVEIEQVHRELGKTLEPFRGEFIMVYHPAFGYFCDAYGLRQVAIEMAGKEPTPGQMARIIQLAQNKDIHVIFVQKQFPAATARAVAEAIDGVVVPLDPLAEDILQGYRDLAGKLSESLSD